jgi:DNA-binding Lrp family transcriptional regulator
MPVQLDETDQAIIKVLAKDGRKSFRQIARETGISTPTAKARYNRMINIGFLKSVQN